MAHRYIQEYPQLKELIFIDYNRFGSMMSDLSGISNVHPAKLLGMISSFYCTQAADSDIEFYDDSGNACPDMHTAARISMNTGLHTRSGDCIWVHGIVNPMGGNKRGVFKAQWMNIRYAGIENGHRLIQKYPELNGFVYLYPKYLAENLVENAGAVLGAPSTSAYLVHRLTDAYRHASDEEIQVTGHGAPCAIEDADEIVIPTGFSDADGNPVYMHCEPADPGKDHPWCLHFFRAAGQEEISEDPPADVPEQQDCNQTGTIAEPVSEPVWAPERKGFFAGLISRLFGRK